MKVLTKSLFLKGFEGDKYLWICANKSESLPKPSLLDKEKISQGILIGELAKKLFEGVDLKNCSEEESLKLTTELKEKKVLFEASFKYKDFFCKVDVLVPTTKGFDVIEVKSSSKIKKKHLEDLAFQKMILEGLGMNVNNYYLMHINSKYEVVNDFELEKFFVKENVTSKIAKLDVEEKANYMLDIINLRDCPDFIIDDYYKSDNGNFLVEDFKQSLPLRSVFNLYSIRRKKAVELYKKGHELIDDLPSSFEFSDKQLVQLKTKEVLIQKDKLSIFLAKIKSPVIHLDFEAYQQGIPRLNKTKAYTHIPFQYSMHIEEHDELIHKEFLYEGKEDPRISFLENLKKDLPKKGSVIVYYKEFEVGRLKELASVFPVYQEFIKDVIKRVVDLRDPFYNFWYYNQRQKCSCSIKDVLKVFSDKKHSELEVSNGSDAMILYKHNKGNLSDKLKKDLLEYCKLDTLAMVIILRELRKRI
ncbi:MAG: DUF2779 domain-containing protein [Candidatus Woesearchaeota archaeon]